jgi:ribosome maturation factor RimP
MTMTEARAGGQVVSPDLQAEFEQIAAAAGCELAHAEWKGGTLRIFLDRPEGVTIADCEHVSKQVSALLDVLDYGRGRYVLEVSSPGLDRELYRPRDYERFAGRLARVTFTDPATGGKKTVVGRLQEFLAGRDGSVRLVEEPTGRKHEIALADIRLARLEIEI